MEGDGRASLANANYPPIDYQGITYYSEPKSKPRLESLAQVDPEILKHLKSLESPWMSKSGCPMWRSMSFLIRSLWERLSEKA